MKVELPQDYLDVLTDRPLRFLVLQYGLNKDTVAEVRRSKMITEGTAIKFNRYFRDRKLAEFHWSAHAKSATSGDASSASAITLEGWELFHHIRRLFLAGREDDALTTAFQALHSTKIEQWTFAGWGFLYVANGTGEPEHFAGVAKTLTHRFSQISRQLPPEQMYLMATDIAKFEAEYGHAKHAEEEYDQLISLYSRFEKRLDPGQQASTWRGHGTLKATMDRFNNARESYGQAAKIQADNMESHTGNFYRISQLALKDNWHSYEKQLDMLWTTVGAQVTCLSSPQKESRSLGTMQASGISQPTLLNALLLHRTRPEQKIHARQYQESLDDFAINLTDQHKVPRPIFQCRPAMFSLANDARNPRTRQILTSFIRKPIDPGLAETVHQLLKLLVRRLTDSA